jgi:glycerol-3-phosphate dehydrogenase (NAD(P)+)
VPARRFFAWPNALIGTSTAVRPSAGEGAFGAGSGTGGVYGFAVEVRAGVIGAGSWGTTVASLLATKAPTLLWARRADIAAAINTEHTNPVYLPGFALHPDLRASSDLAEVVEQADVLLIAVPTHGFRKTLEEVAPHLRPWVPVVSLAKGFEQGSHLRMTEVINEVLPEHPAGVLTGPNLAKEILAGHAAAAVLAMADEHLAQRLQVLISTQEFRVYTNTDVIGCELGGALKNVIALAAGMADGLGTSDNTRAAVITRGLREMTRLGVVMGGRPSTFAGLAGLGDLVATCVSPQSRNRYVGEQLGKGRAIADIVAEMDQVAEGVGAVAVAKELGELHGVDLPITRHMYAVIEHGESPTDAYRGLLQRKPGREVDDA